MNQASAGAEEREELRSPVEAGAEAEAKTEAEAGVQADTTAVAGGESDTAAQPAKGKWWSWGSKK